MNDTELRAHLAEKHPGIGLATGPAGMYPEGRPTMHLEVSHEGQHRDYPTSQDHVHPEAAADSPAPLPSASVAEAGRYIVMRLLQLEERLSARYPRAAADGPLGSLIGCIRDEAAGLAECYEFVPQAGRCEFCHLPGVPLVAALAGDPDQYVCQACHDDERMPTIPLEALQDDRAVYAVTRGVLTASAGRELTEDEIAEVTGYLEHGESVLEAVGDAVFAALGLPEADEDEL
jgi:hypothetical protein